MPYNDILYSLWLSLRYPAGSPIPGRLLRHFRSAYRVYTAEPEELTKAGFLKKETNPLLAKSLAEAQKTAGQCSEKSIGIISYTDANYPVQLIGTDSPPAVLYCRGRIPSFDDNVFISAVGTRKMSDSGRLNAHRLCFDIASAGAVVVSGMARGIDSMCHMGAIDGGGTTLAVLGCGADVIYPPENSRLYASILEHGGVISEYPPGTEPKAEHFPVRNRLIAALGASVIVVEAGLGSGALITADDAMKLGRRLFAVPGPINTPSAKGSNRLLKQGAVLCTGAEDILTDYELSFPHRIRIESIGQKRYFIGDYTPDDKARDTSNEKAIASTGAVPDGVKISRASELKDKNRIIYERLLSGGMLSPEQLVTDGLAVDEAIYRLTLLEIAGYITLLPGGKYTVK